MQYVGKVGDYVYNQWNSLNPATLSGAIDIIVIEQPDGLLHTSPWHVRFGKFQIIKPSQKKIDLYVNEVKTDLPMKLSDGGEAFFVFETTNGGECLLNSVLTSPVISPVQLPDSSPRGSPQASRPTSPPPEEPEELDLENKIRLTPGGTANSTPKPRSLKSPPGSPRSTTLSLRSPGSPGSPDLLEKARKITQKLNIPSKIDVNGDMVLDMDGYKSNARKNIDNSDEYFKKLFFKEIQLLNASNLDKHDEKILGQDLESSAAAHGVSIDDEIKLWDQIISKDNDGNVRISNQTIPHAHTLGELHLEEDMDSQSLLGTDDPEDHVTLQALVSAPNLNEKTYFKTLRLTSEQLKLMNLKYGANTLRFKAAEGTSQVLSNLYFWQAHTPIVISDIDGTITKSDALGHVLNMFGKDWTHPGVAGLFQDIYKNGYNIVYLTARSVGQADTTRQYLEGVAQEGIKLPRGPVILSPDRTMAALKREIVLKKPEVFKMACLSDIRSLYFDSNINKKSEDRDERTPFYAGFGNRITDAISYRSVKIPLHRIFTINPNGEVKMELLQLAGYKLSYLHIGELVDHFFPPIKAVLGWNAGWNNNQLNEYIHKREDDENMRLNTGGSDYENDDAKSFDDLKTDERFNDVNYWREPMMNFDDLLDEEDDIKKPETKSDTSKEDKGEQLPIPEPPKLPTLKGVQGSRPSLMSFSSPLKSFMMFGNDDEEYENKTYKIDNESLGDADADDDDTDDDYTDYDDGDVDDDDDYDDDYDDEEDYDEVEDVDEDDIDQEDLHDDLNQTLLKTENANGPAKKLTSKSKASRSH